MEKVTIYTLAKELNMSPSMVSRAFSPNGRIDREKRRLVLALAEKRGYAPNTLASRLSMREIRIAVVISSRFAANTEKMLLGAREAYEASRDYKIRYDVITLDTGTATDADYDETLQKCRRYDGVLIAGMSAKRHAERIRRLCEAVGRVVLVQAVNLDSDCLFASKHDETLASRLSAEFLSACLRMSTRKNVLLFTGDLESALHKSAADAFRLACTAQGLNLLSVVDMKDDEAYFEALLPSVMQVYGKLIDGIYITSGLSKPLCAYLEEHRTSVPFVAFDTYETVREYMKKGIVTAAVSQNVKAQMRSAFEMLVRHITTGELPPSILYTDVSLALQSNVHQFD